MQEGRCEDGSWAGGGAGELVEEGGERAELAEDWKIGRVWLCGT